MFGGAACQQDMDSLGSWTRSRRLTNEPACSADWSRATTGSKEIDWAGVDAIVQASARRRMTVPPAVSRDRRGTGHAAGVLRLSCRSRLRPLLRRRRPEPADHRGEQQPEGNRRRLGHRTGRSDRAPAELPQPLLRSEIGAGVLHRRSGKPTPRDSGAGPRDRSAALLLRGEPAGRGCARHLATGRSGCATAHRRHRPKQSGQRALPGGAPIRRRATRQPPACRRDLPSGEPCRGRV